MAKNNRRYVDELKKEIKDASTKQAQKNIKYVVSLDLNEDEITNMKRFVADLKNTANRKNVSAKSLIYDILKDSGLFEYKTY